MSNWVSLSEYGRLRGCSAEAVRKAIKTGRLKNSVRKNEKDKYEVNPITANLEWQANTDHTMRRNATNADTVFKSEPAPPPARKITADPGPQIPDDPNIPRMPTVSESNTRIAYYRGLQAQAEYEEMMGALVSAEDVKKAWHKIITEAKTRILALPAKAKTNIQHLTQNDVSILERLVRESLEELAHGNN